MFQFFHGLVAKGQIQCQQDRARSVTEISPSGYNRGDDDDPNSCKEDLSGASSSSCEDLGRGPRRIYRLMCIQQ
jgi:hypothetical protein